MNYDLTRRERVALRLAFGVLGLLVALILARLTLGIGGEAVDTFMVTWGSSLVYVLAAAIVVFRTVRIPEQRAAWTLLAIGLCVYGAGNVVWTIFYNHLEVPPIPSVSDGMWLALYPASYVGLVLLARGNNRGAGAGVWLDGIVAGLGFAAVGTAVVFGPVVESATGSPAAVVTNLAYPVADSLLAALVVGIMAVRGWRLGRKWAMLGGGFLLLSVADSLYLLQVASGASESGLLPNLFYLTAVSLLALSAWQPASEWQAPSRAERWSVLLIPAAFVMTAMGLLLYDHVTPLQPVAFGLAVLTMFAAMVRAGLSFRDIRALATARLEATTDDLTLLPNRRHFLRRLDDAIVSARESGESLALLIMDLDEFKHLNDTLGHQAGDSLLCQIGPRVSAALRPGDTLARLGGDEFGILLANPCDHACAIRVAERIGESLHKSFEVEGLHLRVAASVGIALFPEHSSDARQLLSHADVAMYQAKATHTGHDVYAPDRHTDSRDALQLASELPQAIVGGEMELHFQPKAKSTTGHIVGMEALVRWNHPQRGLLAPAIFVPLAEQSGLMRELTRTVMAGSLAACRRWREAGHDLNVSVNVSFSDLLDTHFPAEVAAALVVERMDPASLIIEVTESAIMADASRVTDVLQRLSELGISISLDDFGTGYSSLTHLRTLPVGEIKIDRTFVAGMRVEPTDEAIVRSTIQLAHNLGMRVVAEGVEDDETWCSLTALGCDRIQGYYLSRPMPSADVEAFLVARAMQAAVVPRERALLDQRFLGTNPVRSA
jgi:diguanylate cyclase (GGDEF)-like protein